mmetsp:Transcript_7633/g.15317  ORF Transcript_7633/g.15317 Transcript_7633/m.15317 type:complete len:257 (+) Transcript_7633:2385-3155(+)
MKFGDGECVLVSGGTGIVGSGIIDELVRSTAATVVALVRCHKGPQFIHDMEVLGHDLGAVGDRFVIIEGIDASGQMSGLVQKMKESGIKSINHVVSCFGGGFKKGPMSTLGEDDLHECVDRSMPHIRLMKEICPMMRERACGHSNMSYTFVDGMLGERCHMPQVAGLSVSNSFLYGCILAFQAENKDINIRINEVRIGVMVRKDATSDHPFMDKHDSSAAYPASLVGRHVIDLSLMDTSADRRVFRITSQELGQPT